MMSFRAYCFKCEKSVTVFPILGEDELRLALFTDAEIEVMHLSDEGDHRWKLNRHQKEHLRNLVSKDLPDT